MAEQNLSQSSSGSTTQPYSESFLERLRLQYRVPEDDQSILNIQSSEHPENFHTCPTFQSPKSPPGLQSTEDLEDDQSSPNQADNTALNKQISVQRSAAWRQKNFDIRDLDTQSLDCRLLIQPANLANFKVPGANLEQLHRRQHFRDTSDECVTCFSVKQTKVDACCYILAPLRFQLYYDPLQDTVELHNAAKFPICIQRLPVDTEQRVTIIPGTVRPLAPGAWAWIFEDGKRLLQIKVFGRNHSLQLMSPCQVPATVGSKRRRSARDPETLDVLGKATLIKHIDSLAEAKDQQVVGIAGNNEDYRILRMVGAGQTTGAMVFKAKHSKFTDQVIVVKVLKRKPNRNAIDDAMSWLREYHIHRRVKSEAIVKLFAGDARFHAFFLEHVNAYDLSKKNWRDDEHRFSGNQEDVKRILVNMSRALCDLRKLRILHNDIKPANILYNRERGAVLIDFGLATIDDAGESNGGTPWYVAPEFSTSGRREAPAEVWALGVVMIYLLKLIPLPDTGLQVRPWQISDVGGPVDTNNREALFSMRNWGKIVEEARANLDVSKPLDKVVSQMLDMKFERRITAEKLNEVAANLE